LRESFSVLQGELTVVRDGQRSLIRAGERVDIEPGEWHDWFNAGDVDAVVRVEVTPGERFAHMIETLFGLAREGHVNAKGMPNPLQLALTAQEFSDATGRSACGVWCAWANRAAAWLSADLREPLAHDSRPQDAINPALNPRSRATARHGGCQ
jgi:hypothetical protein